MSVNLVFTVIAADQPGVVELLSQTVADHGANWLGSRMARLAGEFAGIVEVDVPEASADALCVALNALDRHGLRVQLGRSEPSEPAQGAWLSVGLELVGDDRPGIVHEISQALALRGVNVSELATSCESAPMSGEPLFRATASLLLPSGAAIEELRAELEKIAQDLMVDLTLE